MPSRATRAAGTRQGTCASCTGGAITGITSGWDTKRQRLEPDAEQSARPVLRGLGSGNGARLPAYAYGRTAVASGYGAAGSVKVRRKARSEWLALKPNTHDGYVSWERFEAIRTMVSSNVPTGRHHGAPKHGDALLAGLIRCKRCGRKLTLRYSGMRHHIPRYSCSRAWMDNGGAHCIAFGGLRVDDAIEEALLGVVGPGAIAAATAAAKGARERRDQVRDALSRDLEAARYAADRALRQYDAADPANRLVA